MLLGVVSNISTAQEVSKEDQCLSEEEVPSAAKEFIKSTKLEQVTWHKQQELSGTLYEAKFEIDEQSFIVIFNPEGIMTDIKLNATLDQFDSETKKLVKSTLDAYFHSYTIQQIQEHYVGDHDNLLQGLINKSDPYFVIMNYELIIKGVHLGSGGLFKMTFNDNGHLLTFKKISLPVPDDFDY
jgi:hypothetical protein